MFFCDSSNKNYTPGVLKQRLLLRLDATTKKRYNGKLFKLKKFSIKQAIFITDIFPSRVKGSKQKKKLKFFFAVKKNSI